MEAPRFYTRNLPHWQPEGVTFAIQFRLAGTLPRTVIARLQRERDQALKEVNKKELELLKKYPDGLPFVKRIRIDREKLEAKNIYRGKFDSLLDNETYGPTWLRQPEIANIVKEPIHYLEDNRSMYKLLAYCIMPNHVHMVISDVTLVLYQVLKRLKQFTSLQANIKLGRTGNAFWHRESYDHIIRNEKELQHQIAYVINNPVKARLVNNWKDWEFSYLIDP